MVLKHVSDPHDTSATGLLLIPCLPVASHSITLFALVSYLFYNTSSCWRGRVTDTKFCLPRSTGSKGVEQVTCGLIGPMTPALSNLGFLKLLGHILGKRLWLRLGALFFFFFSFFLLSKLSEPLVPQRIITSKNLIQMPSPLSNLILLVRYGQI